MTSSNLNKGRVLSGMQPTGQLHLGNYLGALRNWVRLQDDYDCLYCVADLHSLTLPQDPMKLRQAIREVAASYIAAGVDTSKSILFAQSSVPEHLQLAWVLGTRTPMGWLNRMTQYKDKSGKSRDLELWGLYSYPVLQAADILLYSPTHVPIGEDQKQHVELARDIALSFNHHYEREAFVVPEPMMMGEATRVMSLRDGTKKMSKSDESDYSRINLTDDADTIALKIRKAKTDPAPLPATIAELEARHEAANLLTIFAALSDKTRSEIMASYEGQQFSALKNDLTDLAVAKLAPITEKFNALMADPAAIDRILLDGAIRAGKIARPLWRETAQTVGIFCGV